MIARLARLLPLVANLRKVHLPWIAFAAFFVALLAASASTQSAHARPTIEFVQAEFKKKPTPTILGVPTVGSYLTVVPGVWDSGAALSIQWERNFTAIKGQTKSRYLLTRADLGRRISVTVTGVKKGYVTHASGSQQVLVLAAGESSAPSPAPSASPSPSTKPTPSPSASPTPIIGKLTLTPTPTIAGNASVGSELQAVPGTWDSGVQFSYQWFRGVNPIVGATGVKYVVAPADSGFALKVMVTGSKANFISVERTSATTRVVASGSTTLLDIPQTTRPQLNGVAQVGQSLSVNPGLWTSGVSLSIQWFRSGQPIQGGSSAVYRLSAQDLDSQISVTVTGSMAGYKSVTLTSSSTSPVSPAVFAEIGNPTISGTMSVGSNLRVIPGTWDNSAQLGYQWLLDGRAIDRQISASYVISPLDLGKLLGVRVTATAPGYRTEVKEFIATAAVTEGALSLAPNPVITGSATLGANLSASPGVWSTGVSLKYQWNRNGLPISGATSSTYKIVTADVGVVLSVTVTGSMLGFQTIARTTTFTGQVASPDFPSTPAPQVLLLSGQTYSVAAGLDWGADVVFSYQWMRNGVPIVGANAAQYTATVDDAGQTLSLAVTGSKPGVREVTKLSAPLFVPLMKFTKFGMTISWSNMVGKVDSIAQAVSDTDPGVTITYQWTRNGVPIAGATESWYRTTLADAGQSVGVSFVASKPGYATRSGSVMEQPVRPVLKLTPKPTITGDLRYFSTLTANPGVWDDGVRLIYNWFYDYDGPGPGSQYERRSLTSEVTSYTGVQTANGRFFQVCVIGTKPGYDSVEMCSDYFGPMQNNTFPNQPRPRILGTPGSGSTLTVDTSGWLSGAQFKYGWIVILDGIKTSVGSNSTYSRWDVSWWAKQSRKIQLKLEVIKDGYDTVTVYSDELTF